LKEIASRGEVEDEALYQYVIDGIDDTPVNKNVLYGARNTREFKVKLKIYATMKTKTPVYNKTANTAASKKTKAKEKEEVRCYNCGALGHRSTECESKSKGMKCFNCNEFGHKASDCKKEKAKKKKDEGDAFVKSEAISSVNASRKMCKTIEIRTKKIMALVDTGSQFNIINERIHEEIGSPVLLKSTLCFSGFGRSKVEPKDYFKDIISIDGECFAVPIYVVANDVMNMDAVIGNELLSQAELNIKQNTITVKKLQENVVLLPIHAVEDDVPDTLHIACRERREELEQLLKEYQPQKTKSTDIEMTIILLNHQKIAARPRRLPFPERRIVEEQVEQ